jgi:anti-sigma B factor antagonist
VQDHRAPGIVQPLIVPEIVSLPPEIDVSNADAVLEELRAAARPGVAVVIADMTATAFCDSSGVRALLLARDAAARHQAELRLVVPGGMVLRILQVMGMNKVLQIYPSRLAALSGSPSPAGPAG